MVGKMANITQPRVRANERFRPSEGRNDHPSGPLWPARAAAYTQGRYPAHLNTFRGSHREQYPLQSPRPRYRTMTPLQLAQLINDPRGPEMVLPTLTAQDLSNLIDALYRNLDTPSPALEAESWYELAVQEDLRRSSTPPGDAPRSLDHDRS
jgi:hypothetical protein